MRGGPPTAEVELDYWSIPCLWPGEPVVVLAGGKSLKPEQVEHVKGKCPVIAINRAHEIAPWADMLWGCDQDRFWTWYPEAVQFPGLKVVVRACDHLARSDWQKLRDLSNLGVKVIRHSGLNYPSPRRHEGASPDPRVVRGNNALYQILSVIAHTGAKTVVMLGADMRGGHWHGGYHVNGFQVAEPDYLQAVIPPFETLLQPLERAGVCVLNASPRSLLPWFRQVRVEDVL